MSNLLPADFSIADGIAVLWLILVWVCYGRFADRLPPDDRAPKHLNEAMHQIRRVWMRRMLDRHDRIVDSSLTGHTVSSIGFFASTSMIIIAGLLGLLGRIGAAQELINSWSFAVHTSEGLFQLKMLGLVAVFIHISGPKIREFPANLHCCAGRHIAHNVSANNAAVFAAIK